MESFVYRSRLNGYFYPVLGLCMRCLCIFTVVFLLSSCHSNTPGSKVENPPLTSETSQPPSAETAQTPAHTPVNTDSAPKRDPIAGKWYGYWETPWGQASELLIHIAHTANDRYRITVYESAEEYAPVSLEIGCTLAEQNTLVFDSGEMISEGKGRVTDGLLKGSFQGSENGTFVLHAIHEKADIDLAGQWQGQWRNPWGQQEAISIAVTDSGNGQYQLTAVESFEPSAMALFSLDGQIAESGQISFAGQTEIWTGRGKGFCDNQTWSGTFEGDESGHYMLRRVRP